MIGVIPVRDHGGDAARFGAALREQRRIRGWSQQYVADAMTELGFSWRQTTCTKSEAGERPVSVAEAASLAELLAVPVAALFGQSADRTELIADVMCARARYARAQDELAAARTAYFAARDTYAAAHVPTAGT